MKNMARFLVLFAAGMGVAFSGTAAFANTSTLKCNSNKDRVWVYDSLTSFSIEAKLNCGESVEIVERVKDYVRIRARNGVEGYVPETAFSDLPAFAAYRDAKLDVGAVSKQVQAKEIAEAAKVNSLATGGGDSRVVSTAAPANPSIKSASVTKQAAQSSLMPASAMAEMNPYTAPAKNTSPDASASVPTTEPVAPADVAGPPLKVVAVPARSADGASVTDESLDLKMATASADPACQRYFSAYGLTASQLKWIALNRKKMFPSVCPAPTVSKVNYVIIFTHDVDFFNATMPEPVHSINGFSDFQPLTPVDSALLSEAGADKAHREYVWIFQFGAGNFNPATFSPHSQYQFTKVETNSLGSKAGPKAVEDALRFVESANR
jgi:hypothetical protein